MLAQMARRFCIDEEVLSNNELPPVIHQRQLATALWLRTGEGVKSNDIPRHAMLAACDRVLGIRRSMVDRVRTVAKSLTDEKAEQLDLILSQDRSVQMLQDKTLGVAKVVTPDNFEELLEVMKAKLITDVQSAADATVAEVKKDAQK